MKNFGRLLQGTLFATMMLVALGCGKEGKENSDADSGGGEVNSQGGGGGHEPKRPASGGACSQEFEQDVMNVLMAAAQGRGREECEAMTRKYGKGYSCTMSDGQRATINGECNI